MACLQKLQLKVSSMELLANNRMTTEQPVLVDSHPEFVSPDTVPFGPDFVALFPGTTFRQGPEGRWYSYKVTMNIDPDPGGTMIFFATDIDKLSRIPSFCQLDPQSATERLLIPLYADIPGQDKPFLYSLMSPDGNYSRTNKINQMVFHHLPITQRPKLLAEGFAPLHTSMTEVDHQHGPIDWEGFFANQPPNRTASGYVRDGIDHVMQLFTKHCQPQQATNELINSLFTFRSREVDILEENVRFTRGFYENLFHIIHKHLAVIAKSHNLDVQDIFPLLDVGSIQRSVFTLAIGRNGALGTNGSRMDKDEFEFTEDTTGNITMRVRKERLERLAQEYDSQRDRPAIAQTLFDNLSPHQDSVYIAALSGLGLFWGAQEYCPLFPTWSVPEDSEHIYKILTTEAIECFTHGLAATQSNSKP